MGEFKQRRGRIDELNEISGISPIKFEAAQILFSSDVFVAVAIVISYDPYSF